MTSLELESLAIAQALRQRDPDLLNRLIEQHQHRLLRYLKHLTGDEELSKDVCQETWMRVLERGHQYNGRSEFRTWLFTVARNLAFDQLRKKKTVSLERLLEASEGSSPFEQVDTLPSAWESMMRHEQVAQVSAALAQLPAEYREMVALRFQEGLKLDEISEVTRTPLGTVKSRLYRGLNLLLKQMKGTRE